MFRTKHFQCRGHGFYPWLGNQDATYHAVSPKKKKKKKRPEKDAPRIHSLETGLKKRAPGDLKTLTEKEKPQYQCGPEQYLWSKEHCTGK